jgi:hypothetical protein
VLRIIVLHPALHAKAGIRAAIEKRTHGWCPYTQQQRGTFLLVLAYLVEHEIKS